MISLLNPSVQTIILLFYERASERKRHEMQYGGTTARDSTESQLAKKKEAFENDITEAFAAAPEVFTDIIKKRLDTPRLGVVGRPYVQATHKPTGYVVLTSFGELDRCILTIDTGGKDDAQNPKFHTSGSVSELCGVISALGKGERPEANAKACYMAIATMSQPFTWQ